jgi:hypothetical protein
MLQHFTEMLKNNFLCSTFFTNVSTFLKNVGSGNYFFNILQNVAIFFRNVGQYFSQKTSLPSPARGAQPVRTAARGCARLSRLHN